MSPVKYIFIIISALLIAGCHSHDKNTLRVGVMAGPEAAIMETAKTVANNQFGLNIKIVEFSDYLQPNAALSEGAIDANLFQHQPYLDQQIKDRQYKLVSIGKMFLYPMGIYSDHLKSLKNIAVGGTVVMPNDPSNEGRALLLLQSAKLISLDTHAGVIATPGNIVSNPKHLIFKELDAAQIPRSLPDVALGIINTNYALLAGLSKTNVLWVEDRSSPYVNIVVVRQDNVSDPRFKQLMATLHSPAVLETAKHMFHNQAIAGW